MIEHLFDMAIEHSPSILIFEEVDSIGRKRSTAEKDSERRLKIEFLRQMDRILECEEDISFLGTTNLPWELDIAFLRRFERKILVPLLGRESREQFLRYCFKDSLKINDEGFKELSRLTLRFNGAEIKNFVRDVMLKIVNDSELKLDLKFLKKVLKNYKPCIS